MTRLKQYSLQFKARVVLELVNEEVTVTELLAKHGIHPLLLTRSRVVAQEKLSEHSREPIARGKGKQNMKNRWKISILRSVV